MQQIQSNKVFLQYLHAAKKYLPSANRKRIISVLESDLQEYAAKHPSATWEDLIAHFGAPESFAEADKTDNTEKAAKKLSASRRYLLIALIILAATSVVVVICALILNYHLAQPDIALPWPPVSEVSKP